MSGHSSPRKSGKLLTAAVASASLASFAAPRGADAGLMVDLQAIDATSGSAIAPGGKSVLLGSGVVTITIGVFARVSGTNAVQQIGDWDAEADSDDTRNDEMMGPVTGSFASIGGLLGDMAPTGVGAGPNSAYNTRIVPFTSPGSQNGSFADFDSDGDLDIGASGTDSTAMWRARASGSVIQATLFDNDPSSFTGKGWSFGAGAGQGLNTRDTIIDPTTSELQVGIIRFVPNGGSGLTAINFVPRPGTDAGTALWFEDGIATGKMPGTGSFSVGPPVNVFPEPAAAGLLGTATLGLLARRRGCEG